MKVEGQCHCGQIRFTAEVDPGTARVCHCTDCQKFSGGAFRTGVIAPAETFTIEGEPTRYVKTADSGAERVQAFCPSCGCPIYTTAVKDPKIYVLRTPMLAQKDQLPPRNQIWRRSALAWVDHLDDIPGVDGQA
jgi:hypothetical protein